MDDGVVVVQDLVGQKALAQVQPDALNGVEFRAVGRERHQRDVVRDDQRPRSVLAGLIENEHHLDVRFQALGEAIQEQAHDGSGNGWHDQRVNQHEVSTPTGTVTY
ncbi:hypothetical protein ABNQ39_36065 (plasmid) [Azospirillum sp. A26]